MKIKLLLGSVIAIVALSSCRKYNCECSTEVYDADGYYVTSTYDTHQVKARTTLGAMSKCDEYDTGVNTYCSIY